EDSVVGGYDPVAGTAIDHGVARRNELLRARERRRLGERGEGKPQDLAPRRVGPGQEEQRVAGTEDDLLHAVREARERLPRAVGTAQVVREVAAVPVRDRGQDPLSVAAPLEADLGDAREVAPDLVAVLGGGRAEAGVVAPHEGVEARGRPLAGARIARVEEALAVRVPGEAAARGSAVHAGHGVADLLPGRNLVDVDVAGPRSLPRRGRP